MANRKSHIHFLLTPQQWLGIAIIAVLVAGTMGLLHFFAPVPTPSTSLVTDSINPWQASNILKYRAKGGRYRRASDLKRLYGMTDSMYQCLLPYVCIDTIALVQRNDSLHPTHSRYASHKRDTLLNLRTADTTELQLIRGIGSYRARQIVHYRQSLGGFASVDQLTEIPALSALLCDSLSRDSLLSHFFVDSVIVVPLRVNTMRPEQLHRHPYLSFSQAQSLYELRRRRLYLDSIEQLRSLETFTDSDIQRLRPYLDFSRREK